MGEFSNIIAKAAAKDKFLDFRNNLSLAKDEHYAMIHGIGGKEYAANSTIKLLMTDYTGGTGNKSVTVNFNVTPDVVSKILEVCRRNIGTSVVSNGGAKPVTSVPTIEEAYALVTKIYTEGQKLEDGNMAVSRAELTSLGKLIGTAREALNAQKGGSQGPSTAVEAVDFELKQDKVDAYASKDSGGRVPVSTLLIKRETYRSNGELSKYPWTVKICNFKAKTNENKNGTISYDSKTMAENREAFIQISNDDMYRCCHRVESFVRIWENAVGIPLVLGGLETKEAKRQEYLANRG